MSECVCACVVVGGRWAGKRVFGGRARWCTYDARWTGWEEWSGVAVPLVTSSINVMTLPLPLSPFRYPFLPPPSLLAAISSLARDGPELLPALPKSYCRRKNPMKNPGTPCAPAVLRGVT